MIFVIGKLISKLSSVLNLGNGSTWPGHIALKLNSKFIQETLKSNKIKIIFIVGTNGKTTTTKLIKTVLENNGFKVMFNSSGANLLNGVASSLILNSNLSGRLNKNVAIFEVDENALSPLSEIIEPDYLIALNLFRDQLDRYGEIDSISKRWKETISKYKKTVLILNADDPQIAYLGFKQNLKTFYFGLDEKNLQINTLQHGADSILCPNCSNKLDFEYYYFSHLGKWSCKKCGFKTPSEKISDFDNFPLAGTHAKYNVLAAVLLSEKLGLSENAIVKAFENFKPAFGRQEEVIYKNKKLMLFLSKNPISFNESLDTINKLGGKNLLIALNDKIPDGLDVSWIWDIDFERLLGKDMNISVCGLRANEMSLRLKYANIFNHNFDDFESAIEKTIENTEENETLYILPNYSSMLEIRKILVGKKIL